MLGEQPLLTAVYANSELP